VFYKYSADEGIADFEAGEPPGVPVGGPELADAVLPTDGRHACVVNLGPGNLRRRKKEFQLLPVPFRLPEQHQGRRLQPGVDLRDGPPDRRRGGEDPWMRGDGEKLVDARPAPTRERSTSAGGSFQAIDRSEPRGSVPPWKTSPPMRGLAHAERTRELRRVPHLTVAVGQHRKEPPKGRGGDADPELGDVPLEECPDEAATPFDALAVAPATMIFRRLAMDFQGMPASSLSLHSVRRTWENIPARG